jgi:hypothetical protein
MTKTFQLLDQWWKPNNYQLVNWNFLGKNQKTFSKDQKFSIPQFDKTNDNQSVFDHLI